MSLQNDNKKKSPRAAWKYVGLGILILSLGVITSCKRYPKGPAISLRSKTTRVANTWKLGEHLINGTATAISTGDVFVFDRAGNYQHTFNSSSGAVTETGTWVFTNDKDGLEITTSTKDKLSFSILKLKEKEMWLRELVQDRVEEFHLITN